MQILKDTIPSASRVAPLWNPSNASNAAIFDQLRRAVRLFCITLISIEARNYKDFDRAFAQMALDRPDAVLTTNDPLHQANMKSVIDLLLNDRIPGIFQIRKNVVDGGLMSYGVSFPDVFRRGAVYVDKIMHGAKPQDLPVEQPVTFELIINLRSSHRPRHSSDAARPRRRGDRIATLFCCTARVRNCTFASGRYRVEADMTSRAELDDFVAIDPKAASRARWTQPVPTHKLAHCVGFCCR